VTVDCQDARAQLLDAHAGRLTPERAADLRTHLEGCPACTHEDLAEQTLTEILERRLPQHPASLALKRRLALQWPGASPAPAWQRPWARWLWPAVAIALVVLVAFPVWQTGRGAGADRILNEAVNDHLRILQPERALGVASGGIHQVKPWFAGRIDFAPVVTFEGDADFPLKGGAVEYFLDRRAAVFVYGRRLHTVSLLVFRAEGVPLPPRPEEGALRGFNVVLWRAGDLGYALVSDLDARELRALAARLQPPA
jgi:anti-sigma factor RsiW